MTALPLSRARCPHLSFLGMTGVFQRFGEAARIRAARTALRQLAQQIGAAGLAAAHAVPGVLAIVDQHAAAVRDALGDGLRAPGPVALAGYVEGILAAGADRGWRPPSAAEVDWAQAEWPVLRLVAVCALADRGGHLTPA